MRQLKQDARGWEYELNAREALLLRTLIREFPVAPAAAARITRTDTDPRAAERERLLTESLAAHRQELKRLGAAWLAAGKLRAGPDGWRLQVSLEEREMLLQLLNDVRVESWRALGEPDDLEPQTPPSSEHELRFHGLLNLAGYFEHHLLDLGDEAA